MSFNKLRSLDDLLDLADLSTDLITLEATVVTGFEGQALDECFEKCQPLSVYKSPGRIFFNIKVKDYPEALKLRSIDNVYLVVKSFKNLNFQNDKEKDLEVVKSLVDQINWKKHVELWAGLIGYNGVLFPEVKPKSELVAPSTNVEVIDQKQESLIGANEADLVCDLSSLRVNSPSTGFINMQDEIIKCENEKIDQRVLPTTQEDSSPGVVSSTAETVCLVKPLPNDVLHDDDQIPKSVTPTTDESCDENNTTLIEGVQSSVIDSENKDATTKSEIISDLPNTADVADINAPLEKSPESLTEVTACGEKQNPLISSNENQLDGTDESVPRSVSTTSQSSSESTEIREVTGTSLSPSASCFEPKSESSNFVPDSLDLQNNNGLPVEPAADQPEPVPNQIEVTPANGKPFPKKRKRDNKNYYRRREHKESKGKLEGQEDTACAKNDDNATSNKSKGGKYRRFYRNKPQLKKPPPKPYIDDGILKFRATCYRSGKDHSFDSMAAAWVFGGTLNDKFNWTVDLTRYDLNTSLVIDRNEAYVTLALTKKSFHKRNITHFGYTTLRATMCYNLMRLAQPVAGDIVIDPLCGGGSIPIEGAIGFPYTFHVCGDINEKAMSKTAGNLEHVNKEKAIKADAFRWNVKHLPFKDHSIDVLVTDLPFGLRSGKRQDNMRVYMDVLREMGRVLKPGTGRASLLTNDKNTLTKALQIQSQTWKQIRCFQVNQGGLRSYAFLLIRKALQVIQK